MNSNSNNQTLISSSLFLSAHRGLSPPPPPPLSYTHLSTNSPLPSIPTDFPCPNLIPNTRFIVDGFRSAGNFSVSYFLSHFHSDHYAGLGSTWSRGIIYCSDITGRLLIAVLNVPEQFVVPLPVGESVKIDGCGVVTIDANHCPGAVQFLFEVKREGRSPERYVHTGDFRFHESMKCDLWLSRFVGADGVFLDTTYCNPRFVFPSQEESVDYVVGVIERIREESEGLLGSVLFLIATYVVGKEKILLEIARRCGCLLYVDRKKMEVLSILGLGEDGAFTEDATSTNVHVIGWNLLGETWPFFRPNFSKMKELMVEKGYTRAVGFVSTGWMYETKKKGFAVRKKDELEIHLVPYSEHSSYAELREYVKFLKPKKVIPTVGADIEKLDGKSSMAMQKHFRGLVDEMANKQDFLMAFHMKCRYSDTKGVDDKHRGTGQAYHVEEYYYPTGQEPCIQCSEVTNTRTLEGCNGDLREHLPSWVTDDQILGLLKSSNGDVVQAVSDFFERELEFYNEAKTSNVILSSTQITLPSKRDISPNKKPSRTHSDDNASQGHPEKPSQRDQFANAKSAISKDRTLTSRSSAPSIVTSTKKRGSTVEIKTKKKGRHRLGLESVDHKQSTITKYFGKGLEERSTHDGGHQYPQEAEHLMDGPTDLQAEDLDQFLMVINGGLSRNAAASLMEKAKGNIDVAIDLYYSASSVASVTAFESVLSSQVDKQGDHSSILTDKGFESVGKKRNLPILYAKDISKDTDKTYVSLPIPEYSATKHACWKAGEPAPYLHLARTFDVVEREKGKLKTTAMLCNMFRSLLALSPEDVLPAVYLCTNKIAPDHENLELNVGGGLVVAALEEACGTSKSKIKEMYNVHGDLGDVAQECRRSQSLLALPRPLTIRNLFCMLQKISVEMGHGSASRRKNIMVNLMQSCREMEMKFLVRTLVRNLRIGAMMRTILPALAQAVVQDKCYPGEGDSLKLQLQNISAAVADTYNVLPNLDLLVPELLSKGMEFSASHVKMVSGLPIPPMLARITNGISQVLKFFKGRAFTCEYKYDGQRAQIHLIQDGSIRVFSRQLKESTSRFPDLINIVKALCATPVSSFILDAEVVAVDRNAKNKILSFQDLSSRDRGSKMSSVIDNVKVDICVFVFDVMLLNGKRLLDFPLRERRKRINEIFPEQKLGHLELAREITVEADEAQLDNHSTFAKVKSFFKEACESSCEGIMVKSLDVDAGYCASKRTDSWLKVKRDYVEGLGDSLDLVPIGAWYGNGRKAGWYSPFLMACYNTEAEEYQSVCRVMSGFTDSFYVEMKEFFTREKILPKKPPYYQTDETPDVWFSSELVWEIRGADLTISPVHHAALGLVHPSRGISMRLPRYIRSVEDRIPEDCSTAADVAQMFKLQTRKMEIRTEEV